VPNLNLFSTAAACPPLPDAAPLPSPEAPFPHSKLRIIQQLLGEQVFAASVLDRSMSSLDARALWSFFFGYFTEYPPSKTIIHHIPPHITFFYPIALTSSQIAIGTKG
jgi:hypothetical protein